MYVMGMIKRVKINVFKRVQIKEKLHLCPKSFLGVRSVQYDDVGIKIVEQFYQDIQ